MYMEDLGTCNYLKISNSLQWWPARYKTCAAAITIRCPICACSCTGVLWQPVEPGLAARGSWMFSYWIGILIPLVYYSILYTLYYILYYVLYNHPIPMNSNVFGAVLQTHSIENMLQVSKILHSIQVARRRVPCWVWKIRRGEGVVEGAPVYCQVPWKM